MGLTLDSKIAAKLTQTGWGDRRQNLFIDTVVRSSKFLDRMTIVDGVKSKAQIPVYSSTLAYGSNICDLTDGTSGTMELSEKEVSNKPYTWYFNNCKNVLESTYRSAMLRKGQLNEQTLDDDLKDWLVEHFAKLNGAKCMELAAQEITTELTADVNVAKIASSTQSTALGALDEVYKKIPQAMLETLYNETDKSVAPVIMVNANFIRKYQMEVALKDAISYNGIAEGRIPTYMGMEIVCFSTLQDGEIIVAQPSNLLLITDDYADAKAIQNEYNPKKNLDEWFGQFRIGFSYRDSKFIVYRKGTAITAAEK